LVADVEADMTIPATLHLLEAAQLTWDVAVVGAGPAGAMAARELARRGLTVLLIDRAAFPRWKVCGCCLNAHALAILDQVGLGSVVERSGAVPLQGIRLATSRCVAEVPLSGSFSLSRESLDARLVTAAIQAGAAFLPQTLASLEKHVGSSNVRRLLLRSGSTCTPLAARVVVAADGLGGNVAIRRDTNQDTTALRTRIGAGVVAPTGPAFYEPGLIFMACGRYGYLGLVRLEDGRLNLAAAFDPSWVRAQGGPGRTAADLLAENGWPAIPYLVDLPWRGTPALTRQAKRRAAERIFLIGDAAGYVEPFTGEGIAWALAAGRAAAPLASRAAQRWHPNLSREWEAIHGRLLARRHFICGIAASVLRSSRLTRTVIRLVAVMPGIAAPMTRYLGARQVRRGNGEILSFSASRI
jgi:flavin-dependent dehydrogenase